MRRIATKVATGAVAAAAAISLAAAPASAGIQGSGAVIAKNTMSGGAASITAAATHKWTSKGRSDVSGWGTYTRTSTGTSLTGYIKDSRSGKYHGGLYIKVLAKDKKHYQYVILFAPTHKVAAKFTTSKSKYNAHLQIAEVLGYKTTSGWHLYHPSNPGKFYTIF